VKERIKRHDCYVVLCAVLYDVLYDVLCDMLWDMLSGVGPFPAPPV
jgi:hypothetical protein